MRVERGFLRPEDATAAGTGDADGDVADRPGAQAHRSGVAAPDDRRDGEAAGSPDGEDEGLRPLSDRLVAELTAHRTLALRDALANDPDAAFLALLHSLCLAMFQQRASATCLEISAKSAGFAAQAPDLAATAPARAIEARHAAWDRQLPEEPDALWAWLTGLDADSRSALFAHCVAQTLNAVQEPWNRRPDALAQADRLAGALGLDLAATWEPTAANYLGRVSKAHILAAVHEAHGPAAVQLIDHLRKADMAREAERLLAGSGWLPEPLRRPGGAVAVVPERVDTEVTAEPLPAFLTTEQPDATAAPDTVQAFASNLAAAVAA